MRGVAAALVMLLPILAVQAQTLAPPPPADQPAVAAPPPPAWLPRQSANLVLLDKITARPHSLTVAVGQSAVFGSLTIVVRACDVRPADMPQDATAFLDITDSNAGLPGFHGWMLAAEPAVSMLEHPVYDVRVAGCG